MAKRENLMESIRHHLTWSLSTGHNPQTRPSHRLVGSVHLAYLESCFGYKEGLGQPVRVMVITKSHDKNHGSLYRTDCGCISHSLSLEFHGLVFSSTMQRTVTGNIEMSKERSLPSQSSYKLLIMCF